ncbi:MAG: hypothetical protein AABY03_01850 [Nanoarchaeota archaeon]
MKLPKEFSEYLDNGIIKKSLVNKSRAEFLINESDKSLKGLRKRLRLIGIDEDNANSIVKDCYDILMELIRSKLLLDGYSSSGNFAHEAEISYLKKLDFPNGEILFINDLRYFRNSITYYGKILDIEYAKQVVEFTNKIHPKLKKLVNKNAVG